MNQPYQYVHRQEDSNSTLGIVTKYSSLSFLGSVAHETAIVGGAKYINKKKHPQMNNLFNTLAYSNGGSGLMGYLTSGVATRKGRIMNYGGSILSGALYGALASRD